MPRPIATASLMVLALLLAGPAHAERLGKGRSLVLVGISGHRGQFVSPGSGISSYIESGEVGGDRDRGQTPVVTIADSGGGRLGGGRGGRFGRAGTTLSGGRRS